MTSYAELCVTSNFTFLKGASHPEELVTRAAELGLSAIAMTDHNSVAGVVRAFSALKELTRLRDEARTAQAQTEMGPTIRSRSVTDHSSRQVHYHTTTDAAPSVPADLPLPKLIAGARIVLRDSTVHWLALPTDVAAWSRLTQMLSLGKRRAHKGECHLTCDDLLQRGEGIIFIALLPDPLEDLNHLNHLRPMATAFPGACFLGMPPVYDGRDQIRFDALAQIAQNSGLPLVALGDVMMHRSARRALADV